MALNNTTQEPGSDAVFNDNDSTDTHVGPETDIYHRHVGDDDISLKHGRESRANPSEYTPTSVETKPSHDTDPMDRIETATRDDQDQSRDQNPGVPGTVEKVAHSAKKKLFVHHRHRKGIGKQVTASDVPRKEKERKDLEAQTGQDESSDPSVWQNLWVMLTTFPYWNMAWWSGWCYSIGSALFIMDGAFSWAPTAFPDTEFSGESEYLVPLLFFFGACLYQIGGVMAYLEAVNDGSFAGAAMKRLLKGHQDIEKDLLDAKLHVFFGHIVPHHHHDHEDEDENKEGKVVDPEAGWKALSKGSSGPKEVYDEAKDRVERRGGVDAGPSAEGQVREYLEWRWWPTWHALRTYHIFEVGYIACTIQLFGVTLYGVTSVVILPGILSSLAWWQELAAYWVPQVVASCCFLTASVMFTIMAQEKWYRPDPKAVSWWIGIHALIGSVGFLLCAIFGIVGHFHEWGEYQSSLSSTWGSFFYMLSGLFQWYEAINTNVGPVLAFPNNRTPVVLRHFHSRKT